MITFLETTHLSEIVEKSYKNPVVIFKYSNQCRSSDRLKKQIEKMSDDSNLVIPVYLVVVQKHMTLSKKIEELFSLKHHSPQIIILKNGEVEYTAHHNNIDLNLLSNHKN